VNLRGRGLHQQAPRKSRSRAISWSIKSLLEYLKQVTINETALEEVMRTLGENYLEETPRVDAAQVKNRGSLGSIYPQAREFFSTSVGRSADPYGQELHPAPCAIPCHKWRSSPLKESCLHPMSSLILCNLSDHQSALCSEHIHCRHCVYHGTMFSRFTAPLTPSIPDG